MEIEQYGYEDVAEMAFLAGAAHGGRLLEDAKPFLDEIQMTSNPNMGGNHTATLKHDEHRGGRRPHEWWKRLHELREALTPEEQPDER